MSTVYIFDRGNDYRWTHCAGCGAYTQCTHLVASMALADPTATVCSVSCGRRWVRRNIGNAKVMSG